MRSFESPASAPASGLNQLGQVVLGDLLDEFPSDIRILSDHAVETSARSASVSWVEASELEDPTPYLIEGEFVLTTGLPFRDAGGTAAAIREYVERLVRAGVCALGFGIQPYFDEVPRELVRAAARHALLLLEIPERLPFAAIGLHFAKLLEAQRLQNLRQVSQATGQLLKAALSERPDAMVLETLAAHAPVNLILAGADGKMRPGLHAGNLPDPGKATALIEKLFAGRGPRIEVDGFDDSGFDAVTAYPLRSSKDLTIGAVLVGSDGTLGAVHRAIVEVAIGLLEALARQRASDTLIPGQLAAGLLLHPHTLVTEPGRSIRGKDLLARCTSSSNTGQLRVVRGIPAAGSDRAPGYEPDPVSALPQWRRIFATELLEIADGAVFAITAAAVEDAAVAEAERLGWRLAISEAVNRPDLPVAYQQVNSMRKRLASSEKSIWADRMSWSVTNMLDPEAGRALARRLFRPLQRIEPTRAQELQRTLQVWLASNGNWDASARELGLHRNSVRRHIKQAGDVLGMDLGDAGVRADLLIALSFIDE